MNTFKPFFLPLVLCLLAPGSLSALDVLSVRLSVRFQEMPIQQAMDEVARMANFEWSYNSHIVDKQRRVTLMAQDWTVREILREMLGDEYLFKSSGHYLILKKTKAAKTTVSGVIRSSASGERLANVTVYDRKTLRATTTDSSGFYRLKVKQSTELVVVRRGFQDTVLQVKSNNPRRYDIGLKQPIQPDTSRDKTLELPDWNQIATELDHFFDATWNKWHDVNVPDTLRRNFQMSFLPKLGTNHVLSDKVENNCSINILAGTSAGVRYFEAAGLGNFTRAQVRGFQAAGLFNYNRGKCDGVQAAGLYNYTADTLKGAQLAGLINVARSSPEFALQAAGWFNVLRENRRDSIPTCVQLGGLANTAHQLKGVQAAGLLNAVEEMEGVQASGLVNSAKKVKGVQVSGLVNRGRELQGAQIGLVNHSRKARGLQIGLFNSAKTLHGVQIGLINRSGKRWLPLVNW